MILKWTGETAVFIALGSINHYSSHEDEIGDYETLYFTY